jgi:hypothetical protein
MTWLPEWRVTVGDDVYTTVTSVSYASGRLDIDRQCTAGYCRVEIVNTDNTPFTINVTEPITLELKNSSGTYITVFGGEVSDFNIGVRSPEETGFITTGTILGIGSLARLTKAVYNTALAEGLDGAQIAAILDAALNLSWAEVTPTLTWATYPATTTWDDAESYIGNIDSGSYTMINLAASPTAKSQTLVDQIATSALGQIYEDRFGNVNYDDQDHRANYLAAFGYTLLNGSNASPSSIRSSTQISRIRNSLIYKYGAGYASTYSTSDADSIASYGLNERSQDSNIKTLANITAIANRELTLRKTPQGQLETISFRLDNPDMSDAVRNSLISAFFGQPVSITNLPSNLLGGQFDGFIENITMKATPTYVDISLFVSPAQFSLPVVYNDYALAQTYTADATFTVPTGVKQIAVFIKAKGGNGQNGANAAGNGGQGGTGGGGGGAGAFWNFDVVPAQTYSVAFNTGSTNRVAFASLLSVSAGVDGSAGGAGGGLFSRDGSVVYFDAKTGTPAGLGGAVKTTNGNGNVGGNASGTGSLLTVPTNIGLPATIRAGGGGGGGGSGARDAAGSNFFQGGVGGSGGALDGNNGGGVGGSAFQDGDINGTAGGSGVLGNGGGGGAGGAFQSGFGNGTGGTGSTGTGAVVYIYTR